MLLAALICGLMTAYYFGLRPGAVAAALALGLFLFAPALVSYLAVGGGLVAVYAVGSRRPRNPAFTRAFAAGRKLLGRAWRNKD